MQKPSSLRRRLASHLAVPLLVLFAIDGAISYWAVRHYTGDVYDRWLYDSVHSLALQVRLSGERPTLNLSPIAQEMFEWDDEDRVLFRIVGAKSGHIAGDALLPMHGDSEHDFRDVLLFNAPAHDAPMRFGALTLQSPPPGEKVMVVVGETTRKRERLADEILFFVWFPQFFLLMLAYWAAYRIIFVQTEQIHRLSTSLRDVSYQKLRAVSGHDMPKEMQPLIEALNAMIAKLDAAALAHRTFIANAAHQLRTPLTALNLQAERAIHSESAEDMRQAVIDLQDAVRRATRLTNQLLLLSRAEPEAQSGANRTRTDLYELAFETARDWVPTAVAAAIDLGFDESSAHALAEVDAALVADAINNLLDNALKYCPPHAKITVSVRLLPDPTIVVEDTGPGIPVAERSRVVQRFYRGDNATDDGTGLGLAIAQEVALAHSGQFVIGETEGGGARFEIHLPPA